MNAQTMHITNEGQMAYRVLKRLNKERGRVYETVKFDKVTLRIERLAKEGGYGQTINPVFLAQQTITLLYDGISTEELDIIAARVAESQKMVHPNYFLLAGRILVSNLHKTTPESFSQCTNEQHAELGIIDARVLRFVRDNAAALDAMIDHKADYLFDYIAFMTLEKQYLHNINVPAVGKDGPVFIDFDGNVTDRGHAHARQKYDRKVHDRPQYMFMRVAIEIGLADSALAETDLAHTLATIATYYKRLSQQLFIFATPTNFNSCTINPQLNSCFLLNTADSIEEIMRTATNSAKISKRAGGIGIAYHKIRCSGSRIIGTNGESGGIVPQLKIFNENARCWNQGGGKRPGAFAIYLEPWHGDILAFLRLKLTQGADTERARDLFYALWIPDLFMLRARAEKTAPGTLLSLFSDDTAPGLSEVYDGMMVCSRTGHCQNADVAALVARGVLTASDLDCEQILDVGEWTGPPQAPRNYRRVNVFTRLYERYEREGRAVRKVKPSVVVDAICAEQRDTGVPYVCFKDHVNRQSNQSNLGTIQSSNLCSEIMEWHSKDEYACCSLASVNLKKFITTDGANKYTYDHKSLHDNVRLIVRGLDNIISVNKYPVEECKRNAHGYRPIGIGVQGLADVFMMLRLPFLSAEAAALDVEIFETIYHAALTETCALAQTRGCYSGFETSPASRGVIRPDLWVENQTLLQTIGVGILGRFSQYIRDGVFVGTGRYNWSQMRTCVKSGMRNSLLVALMPTVSTSALLGNNESFEPLPSNIYTVNKMSGKYTVSCSYMVNHLIELGIWSDKIKNKIIDNSGSLTGIVEIPSYIQEIYKPVWEMRQTEIMARAALRHPFVDQGQSLNIHLNLNADAFLRGVLWTGWELGNCTGSYYIRTRPATDPLRNNIAEENTPADRKSVV